MPRRLALGLVALLVLLLAGLFAARRLAPTADSGHGGARRPVVLPPTPVVPPTPIPGRRVSLWFEPKEGDLFRAEMREIPAAADDVAFLRSLASAVLDGPRHPDLLRPFPDGWTVRGAYRLRTGLVVVDLAPPAPPAAQAAGGVEGPPAPEAALAPRWQTGSHEELAAAQAILVTLAKNLPDVTKVILIVGGEPVDTLAGHLDLTHPLAPDLSRAGSEPPLEPPPPEPATPPPGTPSVPEPGREASRPRTDVA